MKKRLCTKEQTRSPLRKTSPAREQDRLALHQDDERETNPEKQPPIERDHSKQAGPLCRERISPEASCQWVCCNLDTGQPVPLKLILCYKNPTRILQKGSQMTYLTKRFIAGSESIQPRRLSEEWNILEIQHFMPFLWRKDPCLRLVFLVEWVIPPSKKAAAHAHSHYKQSNMHTDKTPLSPAVRIRLPLANIP